MPDAARRRQTENDNGKGENMKTETMTTNGVNVDKIFEMVEMVKQAPEMANFRFRARNEWVDGAHNRSTIQGFYGCRVEDTSRGEPYVFDNDEPPMLLGEDRGANPVEFVLHALAGCITTGFVYHAAVRGIRIESLTSQLEGDIDLHGFLGLREDISAGYRNIRVKFTVKADAPEEKLRELIEYAKMRSPVYNTVVRPVPVDVTLVCA
jgi:uncharacterized OsmC-like protein